jgi:hypothetical protein
VVLGVEKGTGSLTVAVRKDALPSRLLPRFFQETAFEGTVQQFVGQAERVLLEVDHVNHVRENVARMATPENLAGAPVMVFDKTQNGAFFVRQVLGLAEVLEDAHELVFVGTAQQHFILNAPQEGLVA